jgi:hypothetical protein
MTTSNAFRAAVPLIDRGASLVSGRGLSLRATYGALAVAIAGCTSHVDHHLDVPRQEAGLWRVTEQSNQPGFGKRTSIALAKRPTPRERNCSKL